MNTVSDRYLSDHTSDVLRRVNSGDAVAVTVGGQVVAELRPPTGSRPDGWLREELASWLPVEQADSGLREFLRGIDSETGTS